ncbi:methyl-accepting chemotaxis protein [Brevibacillus choshinensis]|uniref:methyl-accepting chemotaxis protein n=1 Tax=Brevibacillus choshinensis TaxID=54911 RepID=UPI002E1E53FF|nr:methyl-accepting chemotaxis protein [Brevibacillus choshinensis]
MKSLQAKIFIVFSVLMIITGLIVSFVIYSNSKDLIMSSIGAQARTIGEHVSTQIDAADFQAVLNQVKMGSASEASQQKIMEMTEYEKIRQLLTFFKKSNGLKYLYTMAKMENGQFMYIVDGYERSEINEASLPGTVEHNTYDNLINIFASGQTQVGELNVNEEYGATITTYVPLKDASGQMIGIVGADFDATTIYQMLEGNKRTVIMITSAILVMTSLVSIWFSRMLIKPLHQLTQTVKKVQQGDLTVSIDIGTKDEVGVLGRAFSEMVTDLNRMIRVINANSHTLAKSSFELGQTMDSIAADTHVLMEKINHVRDGAKEQVTHVHNTGTTMKRMDDDIHNITEKAQEVYRNSEETTAFSEQGKSDMEIAVKQMQDVKKAQDQAFHVINELHLKSRQIDSIIGTISEISSRTNLLALNAEIESARVGEAGKGFAVVADEVRKLAFQSTKATENIAKLIIDVQKCTEMAVHYVTEATELINNEGVLYTRSGEAFSSIYGAFQGVSKQIESVTKATEQLAIGSETIVSSIANVEIIASRSYEATDDFQVMMEKQYAVIEKINATAQEFSVMTSDLHDLTRKFKVEVD